MKSFSQLFSAVLLVLASLLSVVRSDAGLIQSTCSKTPLPALCISALNSSPESATADAPHLGLIIVDVLADKTKAALSAIKQLYATRPDLAKRLSSCADSYNGGIVRADIPNLRRGFSSGDYKRAEHGGKDAFVEADDCERNLHKSIAGQTPLSATNQDVMDLSSVLSAIAHQLQ